MDSLIKKVKREDFDIFAEIENNRKYVEELRDYGEHMEDEWGAFTLSLCDLAETHMPNPFDLIIYRQVKLILDWYRKNTKWVEEEVTERIVKNRYLEQVKVLPL